MICICWIGLKQMMENRWYPSMFTMTLLWPEKVGLDCGFIEAGEGQFWIRGFVGLWFSRGQNVGLGTSFYKITSNTRLGVNKKSGISNSVCELDPTPKGPPNACTLEMMDIRWGCSVWSLDAHQRYSCRGFPRHHGPGLIQTNTSCVLPFKLFCRSTTFVIYQLYCYM